MYALNVFKNLISSFSLCIVSISMETLMLILNCGELGLNILSPKIGKYSESTLYDKGENNKEFYILFC